MGQVTSGRKYWSDNTAVAGQQFDYTFDDIGNRKTTTRDTRSATDTPNTLNQYTHRTVPGYVNLLDTTTNTTTVSLWGKESTTLFTPTTRKGDFFRGEIPVTKGVQVEVARLVPFASARWTRAGWSQRDQHHLGW